MKRRAAYDSLARVRNELEVARFALSTIAREWQRHISTAADQGGRRLTISDLRHCLENLELTYIVRLVATFEGVLRDYWISGMRRKTEPDLKPLMNSIASRRRIAAATLAEAHEVREFRNEIMHESVQALRFDFGQCAKRLGTYLSWLPAEWQ